MNAVRVDFWAIETQLRLVTWAQFTFTHDKEQSIRGPCAFKIIAPFTIV